MQLLESGTTSDVFSYDSPAVHYMSNPSNFAAIASAVTTRVSGGAFGRAAYSARLRIGVSAAAVRAGMSSWGSDTVLFAKEASGIAVALPVLCANSSCFQVCMHRERIQDTLTYIQTNCGCETQHRGKSRETHQENSCLEAQILGP